MCVRVCVCVCVNSVGMNLHEKHKAGCNAGTNLLLALHSPPLNDTRSGLWELLPWPEMKESVAVMALRKSGGKGSNCGKVKAEVCRKGMGVTGGGGWWTRWLPPQPQVLAEEDNGRGWGRQKMSKRVYAAAFLQKKTSIVAWRSYIARAFATEKQRK